MPFFPFPPGWTLELHGCTDFLNMVLVLVAKLFCYISKKSVEKTQLHSSLPVKAVRPGSSSSGGLGSVEKAEQLGLC